VANSPSSSIVQSLPFEVGALYHRRDQIHGILGGQQQGGISTPADAPFVIIFTGEAGATHGYNDFWDDEERLHYFGEGQRGDMTMTGGNRAILEHKQNGKRLLMFQQMGHGKPNRFRGEYEFEDFELINDVLDTNGDRRTAIVFRLRPLNDEPSADEFTLPIVDHNLGIGDTESSRLQRIRTKQSLFKRRLLNVEKECRLTGIADLRFLRASHIRPWSKCDSGTQRADGNNGLLLCPQADFLFDQGWISFKDEGRLLVASQMPEEVKSRIGLDLRTRNCGSFNIRQREYLNFHRDTVFEKQFKNA
jgi:5-methylcytosine-specific restriction enzyme A